MVNHSKQVLDRARRTREHSRQLCCEIRQTLARSVVLLWHSRRHSDPATKPVVAELATRAERAKRNRETIVRTPLSPARPL
jgi:hypothetical protein